MSYKMNGYAPSGDESKNRIPVHQLKPIADWGLPLLALTFISVLVFGLISCILIGLHSAKTDIKESSTTAIQCSDGDETTVDVLYGENNNKCEHFKLPNGSPCTSHEHSCYNSCKISSGKASGVCKGESVGEYFTFFSPNCPKLLFISQVQDAINSLSLFYWRDCFLGKCRIYVEYPLPEMTPPIGYQSIPSPFYWNTLDYDPILENNCLTIVSSAESNKKCLSVKVIYTTGVLFGQPVYICEFTFKCSSRSTLTQGGDNPLQTLPFSKKTVHHKRSNTVTNKRFSLEDPVVGDPNDPASFWFPKDKVQAMLKSNSTLAYEWWSSLKFRPRNSTSISSQTIGLDESFKTCLLNYVSYETEINWTGINTILNESSSTLLTYIYNITEDELYFVKDPSYYYSFLYFSYSIGVCYPS